MSNIPIVYIFNAPLSSGCDYVLQTIKQVSPSFPVYGLALGDIVSVYKWFTLKDRWVVRRVNQALIFRPISLLPGVGTSRVRWLTYLIFSLLLKLYIGFRYPVQKKIVWFFEPFHMPVLLRVFSGYVSLYDCVDYYPGFTDAAKIEHLRCMKKADFVFANSYPLAYELKKIRHDTIVVPQGFASDLFDTLPISPTPPHKKTFTVGFVGGISDRIDFPMLCDVVRKLPTVKFVFVGPVEPNVFGVKDVVVSSFQRLLQYHNVTWLGEVPKRIIPSMLQKMDVGIIPYRDDRIFNRYSFPMKVLEYFAAGKPVVSGNIAALYPYEKKQLLTIARNANAYIKAIRAYQATGWSRTRQRLQVDEARTQCWIKKITAIRSRVL